MKKIIIFPGSQRKQSLNRRLGSYLESRLKQSFMVELLEGESVNLPLFNQNLESDPLILEEVTLVYQQFFKADGIIVISPEYNGSFTPYLKNTVDWVSRLPRLFGVERYSNPFYGKPILLASATPGRSGGTLGLQSTRNLFAYVGGLLMAEQISLPFAGEAWDENQILIDPTQQAFIGHTLDRFGGYVNSVPVFSQ